MKELPHSSICVKGISFGCEARHPHTGQSGVWVSLGCNGTFDLGPGKPRLACASRRMGRMQFCPVSGEDSGEEERHSQSLLDGLSQSGMLGSLLGSAPSGSRRLSAVLGLAPAKGGGEELRDWLVKSRHPWAENIQLFDSAEDLQQHVSSAGYPAQDLSSNTSSMICGAVVFKTPPSDPQVSYTLRFNTSLGFDPSQPKISALLRSIRIETGRLVDDKSEEGPQARFNTKGLTWYAQSGFLSLQRTVDTFIAEVSQGRKLASATQPQSLADGWLGEDGRPHVVMPFPTAAWTKDIFSMLMPSLLASFLLISLTYSVNRMITAVVYEREARLRDGMRMMGMHPAAFYTSWIITYLAIYLFVAFTVTLILSFGRILPKTSPSLIFVWLMLFATAAIAYAFLITTFFSKAKSAASVGSIAFYSSGYLVHLAKPTSPPNFLRMLSLFPPVCFELTAKTVANLESDGVGLTWSNMDIASDGVSLLFGFEMLLFDAVVLFLLFIYLDQVMPREVGLRREWYFPLKPSFWREICCGYTPRDTSPEPIPTSAMDGDRSPERTALVEREVGEAAAMMARNGQTVELVGLTKYFGDLVAVRELDLIMYQGEIFALLGHNGAGKTTTLAMLCGLMPPSRGTCVIFGHDNTADPAQAQKLLGVCPQHDVLWEELTSEEHLVLYAGFKGVEQAQVSSEVAAMLQRVGLAAAGATKTQAGKLSGGMKRKLSLGIAFLGASRLVVLDEPTSGLDPYSRRMVWELLRAMKQGRVTVLSTHYMDEADILGDRIAILHEGALRCCGSPQFLKRAYDCGYNITFVKKSGCLTDAVREAVCRNMPELASEVITLSDSGKEVILQLPFAASRLFPKVLGGIETQLEALCLESYGVSVTTLEEVFLKVASGERVAHHVSSPVRAESLEPSGELTPRQGVEYIELKEAPLDQGQSARELPLRNGRYEVARDLEAAAEGPFQGQRGPVKHLVQDLKVLIRKRWRYGLRDKRSLLCQLFLPSLTLVLFLLIMSQKLFSSQPELQLSAGLFNQYCLATPQNIVDYTYLDSVPAEKAQTMLEPGKEFWRGELRLLEPENEGLDHAQITAERLTLSGLPGLLHNILRHRPGTDQPEQPGAQTPPLDKRQEAIANWLAQHGRRQLRAATDQWANVVAARHATEGLLKQIQALVPHTGSNGAALARHLQGLMGPPPQEEGPPEGPEELPGQQDGPPGSPMEGGDAPHGLLVNSTALQQLWPPARLALYLGNCSEASGAERYVFIKADKDKDGMISPEELKTLLSELLPKDLDATAAKELEGLDRSGVLKKVAGGLPLKQPLTADAVEEILKVGVMRYLDEDKDGAVSAEEYCRVGSIARYEVSRIYERLGHFSKQMLDAGSPCPRYGAYYVIQGPRTEKTPWWAAGGDAIIFVNTTSSHAAPAFQAALTNARLARLGLQKSVTVHTHPLPQTKDEQNTLESVAVFLLAIYITFCLSFIPAGITGHVVKESSTGAKQLQVLSGASHFSYWFSNLLYDLALYTIPALCVPLALQQFGYKMLLTGECGLALVAVLAAFGPAITGFSYLMSFFYKDHSKAANSVLSLCLIGASVLSTVLFILSSVNYNPAAENPSACERPTEAHPEGTCVSLNARRADIILGPIFRLIPTVCVYQALFSVAIVANLQAVLPDGALDAVASLGNHTGTHISMSPFGEDWAGAPLRYLVIEGIVYFVLAIILDIWLHSPRLERWLDRPVWRKSVASLKALSQVFSQRDAARSSPLIEGADGEAGSSDLSVTAEKERAAIVSPQDLALHVWDLEKTYQHWLPPRATARNAVRGISFAVHHGEVFGLLGHNGAGKTSAIKCFIGEQGCTTGTVHVGGFNMERETSSARRRLGYCPQFDALLELLTVKDHLELFCGLRGLGPEAVTAALHSFKLEKMAHRRADVLSGGNKRKLSAAIALMGNPSLAILDEPSCGLDPAARRALWGAVQGAVAGAGALPSVGRTGTSSAVLLTTHSMEEAEALSTRLGIMADGRLLTVGTSQQIKQRHGNSHELCLTLRAEMEEALNAMLLRFGQGQALAPSTRITWEHLGPLLQSDDAKRRAYTRPRCVVRSQLESVGSVEAVVLAEWWLQEAKGEAIESFLCSLVGENVELAENFGGFWRFRLPHAGVGIPRLFAQMEEHSERLGVAEYTLTQATLEQIFNTIARDAEEVRGLT